MLPLRRLLLLISVLAPDAFAAPVDSGDVDRLQAQFNATTKDLIKNMNVVSADAQKCSLFGGALSSALATPIGAVPPGVAKINASLAKLKVSAALIGGAPVAGVDISSGSASAVKSTQKQISAAIAAPMASIDEVIPVVDDGVRKMTDGRDRALGLLSGPSPACQEGARAYQAMSASAVTAQRQLKAIRGALDAQKTSLLQWNQGVQGSLVSNP